MEYMSTVNAIENFVNKYQQSVRAYEKTRKDSLTFGLVTHSIFFPGISKPHVKRFHLYVALAHWIKTLERRNILIVQSEKLNIFDSQKAVSYDTFLQEMGKVYR